MLAPSLPFTTIVQGFLLLSTLLATAQAAGPWDTAPNTAVFYCGEDGKTKVPTGAKALKWAMGQAKKSPYAGMGRPEYQHMMHITMVPGAKTKSPGAAESKLFAEGASGIVRLFEDKLAGNGHDGVWKKVEEPALVKNPKVTALHVMNPDDPDLEYVVWERVSGQVVYKSSEYKVTGLPISRAEPYEIVWNLPTPPGSPKKSPPGSPKKSPPGSPKLSPAGSPKLSPLGSPKAGSPSRSASKSPSRSASKSPTRGSRRKVRRSRQF